MKTKLKMTQNEAIVGIETMRARIEAFHFARLNRIGMQWKIDSFMTAQWSRAKVLKEFRELPENIEMTPCRSVDCEIPTPKTDAEMEGILKNSKIVLTLG